MKMKGLRVSLALLLVLVMLATLAPAAFAADVERGYTVTLGDNVWIAIESPNAQNVATYSLDSGSLPEGLSYGVNGNSLVVHGTVTALGNTAASFSVTAGPTTYAYNVSFYVTETPVATPAPTADPAAPAAATTTTTTTAPAAQTAVDSKLPRVTKSPTDETVEEGKQAEFVARYENAIWAVWKFISPDGNTVLRYDEAKDYFEGLVIIDGNYSHMILKKIPYSLNGWRVACEYRNNDGSVMTDTATITVIPKVTPTPEPTPVPTPEPTPVPTPAPSPAVSETAGTAGTGAETAGTAGGIDPGTAGVIQATEEGAEGGNGGTTTGTAATAGSTATTGTAATSGRTTASTDSRSRKSFPLIPLIVILLAALAIGLLVFFLRRKRQDEEDDFDYEEPVVRRPTRSSRHNSGYQGRHAAHTERYVEDDYESDIDEDDYDEEDR